MRKIKLDGISKEDARKEVLEKGYIELKKEGEYYYALNPKARETKKKEKEVLEDGN